MWKTNSGATQVAGVLVIGGDLSSRKVVSAHLRAEIHAMCVSDASSAFRMLTQRRFSMVILDMDTPGRGDLEILKYLSQKRTRIPVLLLTGQTDTGRFKVVRDYGPVRTCPKPVDGQAIVRHVREMLAVSVCKGDTQVWR